MHQHDVPTIDVREAARRTADVEVAPTPLIVDVRELDEFTWLRVPDTVLLPISRFALGFRQLPTDRPLLVLCKSGGRSAMATDFLLRSGFLEVHNIAGGILAWQAAGLPTQSGPVEPGEGDLPGGDELTGEAATSRAAPADGDSPADSPVHGDQPGEAGTSGAAPADGDSPVHGDQPGA